MTSLVTHSIGKSSLSWQQIDGIERSSKDVLESWRRNNFLFIEENESNKTEGLRPPQIGGIFAALGHEKSDDNSAATIVMPTGTGKTETILSIVVAGKFEKTLVIVPSDALREQTQNKFLELGLLRKFNLITTDTANPIVATVKHGINDDSELTQILSANVIVASVPALSKFKKNYLYKLTQECSHLIVDEAHHVKAKTWADVKSCFQKKSIFQFTATPFRSDRSRVEGRIIFNYPLKKAQEDGYFKPIDFHPIREFVEDKSDLMIARKAIDLLRQDLDAGLDHIMMARTETIKRAKEVFNIYKNETDLNPILINSKSGNKSQALESIKKRNHRVIVCVNMLGEGFDLPQLKISAIHDPHKSINIMLQFTGRFTRKERNVGNAKFIANIANPKMNEYLEDLYKEDSEWNRIISEISSRKIKDEKNYQRFRSEFSVPSKLLDLGVNPKISTTVYRMQFASWNPESFHRFENKYSQIFDSAINDDRKTLLFSIKSYLPVGWTNAKELFDESWDLYIAHYDTDKQLLFVHSSAKDGLVKKLVNIIAYNASQVEGEYVFRSLARIKRLKLQNVGLNKNKKGLRYSMHTGTEINEQIPDIEAKRATKSNIFGKGYENGELVSIGCSYKGKIWSMDSDSLDKWIKWCEAIGEKILDESIDTNNIMKTAMQTESLALYPNTPILSVEWPIEVLRKNELKIKISSATWEESLINCELSPPHSACSNGRTIDISLRTSYGSSQIVAKITPAGEVLFSSKDNLKIFFGEKELELSDFFNEHPPTFFLSDTSVIDGVLRYYTNDDYVYLYDREKTEDWDWTGVDISIESQTENKIKHSIQYHTIQKIKDDYDLVFDDDGSGEIADIVAIKNKNDDELTIDLYHCKYCSKKDGKATPGGRVDDVYQVSGQAAKSVKWFKDKEKLIERLMERERKRLSNNKSSRIDKGQFEDLIHLAKVARYADFKLGVAIVQPAISKEKLSDNQLSILGATSTYIDEISGVKLRVIINKE